MKQTAQKALLKNHRVVLKDFFRCQRPSTIGHITTVAAAAAAALMLYPMENKLFFWLASGVTVFMLALLIVRVIGIYHTAPNKYAEQVSAFPEDVQDELLREYPTAKIVGTQHYMSRAMVFFRGRTLYALQYKDITGAASKGRDLLLYRSGSEEPLMIPCPARGMAAIVYAYLRSKNPDIKIIGSADRKETTV